MRKKCPCCRFEIVMTSQLLCPQCSWDIESDVTLNQTSATVSSDVFDKYNRKLKLATDNWNRLKETLNSSHRKIAELEKKLKKSNAAKSENTFQDGELYTDTITGMEFVFVKGGCFQMGDTFGDGFSDELPVHEVCVDDFYIGKYPVTQEQWKSITGGNPSRFQDVENLPVEQVSWEDVQDFIKELCAKSGANYRLPTEAEWEFACRGGGLKERYSVGNFPDNAAWYDATSGRKTQPVGTKNPNSLGIYDMSGNVWEWVLDVYAKDAYRKHGRNNPVHHGPVRSRVMRGGSWYDSVKSVRCTNRYYANPGFRFIDIGFRLVFKVN
ncbi:formylglycine-generating enzyme family protein [Candidatus Magnetomonas plexicatena]|uniref:formylglycine-generating enzyme family protein n=1 Tax=Candidatus Magnetomonas plexicatena TaxID=2552947 RepID=UPI001C7714EE|nr:formylglycine-generating enzyme family protein [Nitrospirales bacterium LBB_01]